MIEFQQGDILKADTEALVNTVNCVGIMGRGIALQFRKLFPENFAAYKTACDREEVQPGKMLVFPLQRLHNPQYVINFPTKRHWKGKSRMEDIESGLVALVEEVRRRDIQSIAIPPLGCGLGGLEWNRVRPLIEVAFQTLPEVHVLVYEPAGAPTTADMAKPPHAPRMTAGRAALLSLMNRYLAAVMDPSVTLLEIHKLMYFMQEAGEPLKLRFAKGPYGPYSENLRHVLNCLEGHFINGYGDAEDRPDKQIELAQDAPERAEAFLRDKEETRTRFDRVVNLIRGFETPFGMELLATVHWIARHEAAETVEEAAAQLYSWNSRKKMFTKQQIQLAWTVLETAGWMIHNCD